MDAWCSFSCCFVKLLSLVGFLRQYLRPELLVLDCSQVQEYCMVCGHEIFFSIHIQSLLFKTANGGYLCHWVLRSPRNLFSVFSLVLTDACVHSEIPIVCACFVVACCNYTPRTVATSEIIWDTNTDPLTEMILVGR